MSVLAWINAGQRKSEKVNISHQGIDPEGGKVNACITETWDLGDNSLVKRPWKQKAKEHERPVDVHLLNPN